MSDEEFFEQYKDPRWQRKRLEVMEAAGFKCQQCRSTDKTLNVHHCYYTKGAAPWEYPNDDLRCLCDPCHKKIEKVLKFLKRVIGRMNFDTLNTALGLCFALSAVYDGNTTEVIAEEDHVFQVGLGVGIFCGLGPYDAFISYTDEENNLTPSGVAIAFQEAMEAREAIPVATPYGADWEGV